MFELAVYKPMYSSIFTCGNTINENSKKKLVNFEKTYIFRVISETRAIGWLQLEVQSQELRDIFDSFSNLMQPHIELLF